jgi:hypothetical protein
LALFIMALWGNLVLFLRHGCTQFASAAEMLREGYSVHPADADKFRRQLANRRNKHRAGAGPDTRGGFSSVTAAMWTQSERLEAAIDAKTEGKNVTSQSLTEWFSAELLKASDASMRAPRDVVLRLTCVQEKLTCLTTVVCRETEGVVWFVATDVSNPEVSANFRAEAFASLRIEYGDLTKSIAFAPSGAKYYPDPAPTPTPMPETTTAASAAQAAHMEAVEMRVDAIAHSQAASATAMMQSQAAFAATMMQSQAASAATAAQSQAAFAATLQAFMDEQRAANAARAPVAQQLVAPGTTPLPGGDG